MPSCCRPSSQGPALPRYRAKHRALLGQAPRAFCPCVLAPRVIDMEQHPLAPGLASPWGSHAPTLRTALCRPGPLGCPLTLPVSYHLLAFGGKPVTSGPVIPWVVRSHLPSCQGCLQESATSESQEPVIRLTGTFLMACVLACPLGPLMQRDSLMVLLTAPNRPIQHVPSLCPHVPGCCPSACVGCHAPSCSPAQLPVLALLT